MYNRLYSTKAWIILLVSVLTWTAQLSTKSNGHPLPVTACARGGLAGAVTKCWKEDGSYWGGNSAKT
ncbi:hypothetical protein [Selenomonas ruminantium]|uniref:hypothetical protein n=1 Tax=Selenomonas ruminantium TaxID=971 RepID=UPI00117B9A4F|nr:hypothetical protein [Selenomonas ruminantium]